jgi:ubiquinone/menaquinone biosynthesis C-methylase UbiE
MQGQRLRKLLDHEMKEERRMACRDPSNARLFRFMASIENAVCPVKDTRTTGPLCLRGISPRAVLPFGLNTFLMASPQPIDVKDQDLKDQVREFWNSDPCGSRYLEGAEDFEAHARARYALEPYISEFAKFAQSRGLRVLEIGVGMGADYLEWLKAGARVSGVDLSSASLERAGRRCELAGYESDLQRADAEHLPFPANTFDVVYSYGVMHHSPDTAQCLREAWRVLKPGGQAKIMVYHHPSLTGVMLWLRYGAFRGKTLRQAVYDHLESPGTKTYTRSEARGMMTEFEQVNMRQVFSPGDLLRNQPSVRFQSSLYRLAWKLYPRGLARKLGRRWGLFLLISAQKPANASLRTG